MRTLILLLASLSLLSANDYELQCARPLDKGKPTSNYEIKKFNEANKTYKSCIDSFIREHKQKREMHTEAVNKAIEAWNNHVNGISPKKEDTQVLQGKTGVSNGQSHTVGYSDPTKIFTNIKF